MSQDFFLQQQLNVFSRRCFDQVRFSASGKKASKCQRKAAAAAAIRGRLIVFNDGLRYLFLHLY